MAELRRAVSPVSWLFDRALDVVFPPRCVSCHAFGSLICDRCLASCAPAVAPRCRVCWMPASIDSREPCDRCEAEPPTFAAARAVFNYSGPVRDAVHALKFDGLSSIAHLMGQLMTQTWVQWSPPVDAIVPVPLAAARHRQRGYNQSHLLARHISQSTGMPVATSVLRRSRSTEAQALQPDELSRRRNVAGAFGPGREQPPARVVLIDDVLTTGATLDACARVLLDSGAREVYALTFARED